MPDISISEQIPLGAAAQVADCGKGVTTTGFCIFIQVCKEVFDAVAEIHLVEVHVEVFLQLCHVRWRLCSVYVGLAAIEECQILLGNIIVRFLHFVSWI